jgi:cyclase
MLNKKMFAFAMCLVVLDLCSASAQQSNRAARSGPASAPVAVKLVRDNLYQVSGGVGNAFFYVGPEDVTVIDAKVSAEAARQMMAEIKKITDKPVRRVILTHSDGDHVNGLAGFPAGLTIIAHANARQDMLKANASAAAKLPLPDITFQNALTVYVGDTEVQLLHFGPAHTNGDVVAYFPADKLAIVGDLIFIGRDPLIHLNKHGTSFGLVSVLKSLLKLDADLYLNGHADGVDKNTIQALIAKIEREQAQVKALVQEGKSLAEVNAAFGGPKQPAASGGFRWPSLAETIYRELTQEKATRQ